MRPESPSSLFGTRPIAPPASLPRDLSTWLRTRPVFDSYAYGYPHKTAYRPFSEPRPLAPLWNLEDRSALFLYVHVPFCEMRCGFCNLFTQVTPREELMARYVATLEAQAASVRSLLGASKFARVAVGGGTPTHLPMPEFARVLDLVESFGVDLGSTPASFETSPETSTLEKLKELEGRGVSRLSIGVQSFLDQELSALGRPTTGRAASDALERIRRASIPVLNVDLIYGIPGQTETTLTTSIRAALTHRPEEIFLYPLYLRPLTGLGRRDVVFADRRTELYRFGRELLLAEGYEQLSMRMFRRHSELDGPTCAPEYSCQQDGMVSLGAGARSYTRTLHYSDEWATSALGVKAIVSEWVARAPQEFERAGYGIALSERDQKTRYLIQSVLHASGLDRGRYRARFGSDPMDDRPELRELSELGLADLTPSSLTLRPQAFELSDAIGPWLYEDHVRELMRGFDLR
ncbi:MAG: STM4012 family radical SAM protein [Deltaproteobacteria bacterium]|nr:STM4012 family radical SAM protein [Deltaproteobacteria bacterium]